MELPPPPPAPVFPVTNELGKAGGFVGGRAFKMMVAIFGGLGAGVLVALAATRLEGVARLVVSALVIAAVAAVSWMGRDGGRLDALPWLQGYRGERAVGQALRDLVPLGYRIIHDVETGFGNIDHIVVGPTGVFAIETKHWKGRFYPKSGRLMHGGVPADEVVAQARREALEVKKRLVEAGMNLWVEAIVASTKATVTPGLLTFKGVSVVEAKHLAELIHVGRGRLDPAVCDAAARAIAKSHVFVPPAR